MCSLDVMTNTHIVNVNINVGARGSPGNKQCFFLVHLLPLSFAAHETHRPFSPWSFHRLALSCCRFNYLLYLSSSRCYFGFRDSLSLISGGLHYSEREHRGPSDPEQELLLTLWRRTGDTSHSPYARLRPCVCACVCVCVCPPTALF